MQQAAEQAVQQAAQPAAQQVQPALQLQIQQAAQQAVQQMFQGVQQTQQAMQQTQQAMQQQVQDVQQAQQAMQQQLQGMHEMLVVNINSVCRMHNVQFAVGSTPLKPLRKEQHPQPAAPGAAAGAAAPAAAFGALPGPGIFPPTWQQAHVVRGGSGMVHAASRLARLHSLRRCSPHQPHARPPASLVACLADRHMCRARPPACRPRHRLPARLPADLATAHLPACLPARLPACSWGTRRWTRWRPFTRRTLGGSTTCLVSRCRLCCLLLEEGALAECCCSVPSSSQPRPACV